MSDSWLIIIFLLSMLYLFVTIMKWKMNPFFSMITASLLIGFAVNMSLGDMVGYITTGFGGVMSSLGIVIALGGVLGTLLSEAGATDSLAHYLLKKVGERKAGLAINLTGYIISIPVFFAAGYIVLHPIITALSKRTQKPVQVYVTALSAGLLITHCLVIPTPGPLAVAGNLSVNLGWFIIYSIIISLPVSIVCGWLYGEWIGKRIGGMIVGDLDEQTLKELAMKEKTRNAPAGLAIFLILLPLALIIIGTLVPMFSKNLNLVAIAGFLTAGNGVMSLLISVAFAGITLRKYIKNSMAPMITKAFNDFGEIFMLLGAGGSLGLIIAKSGIDTYLVTLLTQWNISLIALGFILCLLLRTALGSAAIAMVTTSSMLAPVCAQMGTNPIILGLAICSASLAIATPTDAAFWLVQKMDDLSIKDTILTYTTSTVLSSIMLALILFALTMFQNYLPGLAM